MILAKTSVMFKLVVDEGFDKVKVEVCDSHT